VIPRPEDLSEVRRLLARFPVVALLGPRQSGKTTLAHQVAKAGGAVERFDLEEPGDVARLSDPTLALKPLRGLVILDEVQRRPGLFEVLRVLADRRPLPARFLILGSASPELLRQSSESLAGRIAFHTLEGLRLGDVDARRLDRLWLRGGFPRSYAAGSETQSLEWRRAFIRTFLERDIPQLGIRIESSRLSRFWSMLAHYHARTWNAAELARSLAVSEGTVNHYLEILEKALVVRSLKPWHENIDRRQVKAPKVMIRDSGLLHALLGIPTLRDLERHPLLGASWEGFVLQQAAAQVKADPSEVFFWATHGGAKLDMLWVKGSRRIGFEAKRTSAPQATKSLHSAISVLGLSHAYVVHAGPKTFPLARNITAVAAERLTEDL
jgi:predicted AAA+ superfamily ATPase